MIIEQKFSIKSYPQTMGFCSDDRPTDKDSGYY